ncbi:MAG: hypothetical protein JWN71_2987 [Xanthobacteraceae bacterium]|nr:hypothetical protein [Xanthobacteraceae bacterium]
MFADPTINDFIDWQRHHLDKATLTAQKAVNVVWAQAAKAGSLQSGRTIILTIDAVKTEFHKGIESALGELKRVSRTTRLDRVELRLHTLQLLANFLNAMKAATKSDQLKGWGAAQHIDEQLRTFDADLQFKTRQFDVGFFIPDEPEEPIMTRNSISIGTMTGSTIQQSSPHAKQTVEFVLNMDTAKAALEKFESSLEGLKVQPELIDEMRADVATLRAQLAKSAPSQTILQEAGKTLRNVVEGIGAGLLTPTMPMAAQALWSALQIN